MIDRTIHNKSHSEIQYTKMMFYIYINNRYCKSLLLLLQYFLVKFLSYFTSLLQLESAAVVPFVSLVPKREHIYTSSII